MREHVGYRQSIGAAPIIADSARKHGVPVDDMLHAYRHPVRLFELEERDHVHRPNRTAIVFEVRVVQGITAPVSVHAMRARQKLLRW